MEWYRWINGDPIGIFRVEYYQAAFYDTNGCYDESRWRSHELSKAIAYARTPDEEIGSRLYAVFDNGDKYEIFAKKVEEEF